MEHKWIAVFDFDPIGAQELRRIVEEAVRDHPVKVRAFTDIQEAAVAALAESWEMAFVVVEGMPGVESARLIRESAPALPLFLVSSTGDYALEGFRLQALDYLIRPVSAERVRAAVARLQTICWHDRRYTSYQQGWSGA